MKTRTNITIDGELLEKAREKFINISELTENKLRDVLLGDITAKPEERVCSICKKTKDEMVWMNDYQEWGCAKCSRRRGRQVAVVVASRKF